MAFADFKAVAAAALSQSETLKADLKGIFEAGKQRIGRDTKNRDSLIFLIHNRKRPHCAAL